MKRSPGFHLTIGLIVILFAYMLGLVNQPRIRVKHLTSVSVRSLPAPNTTSGLGFIVKYRQNALPSGIALLQQHFKGLTTFHYDAIEPGLDFEKVPSGLNFDEVLAFFRADPNVEYVELNSILTEDARTSFRDLWPNDPEFLRQWGLSNGGQEVNGQVGTKGVDVGALGAWTVTKGSHDVVVAVIDSGVDYKHNDLAENIWVNKGEIPNNGIDDDGNGVVDDYNGYNAVDDNGDPMDVDDHGTHCAGIIGAEGDNGEGVTGVNWHVNIMPVRFISSGGGGTMSDAIEAINYVIKMKKRGVNVRVISASWGGTSYSRALEEAIKAAGKADILFVAAAGNSTIDNDRMPHYPSSYKLDNVLAVAAMDNTEHLAGFSNYGKDSVHIAAPGKDIYSTITRNRYKFMSGTSMATPFVSGVAALVLAEDKNLSAVQLKKRLLDSATPVAELKNKVVTGGRLNAAAALGVKGKVSLTLRTVSGDLENQFQR